MRISGRSMLKGRVVKIMRGAVNADGVLELQGGTQIVSIITKASVDGLGLREDIFDCAVVKASSLVIPVD